MNRSLPSRLQLGEGPELKGFRGARFIAGTEGEATSTARQPLPGVVIRRQRATKMPTKAGSLETYAAVERLVGGEAGGVGAFCGFGPARLSVLHFKLLQLQKKTSCLLVRWLMCYSTLNSWPTQKD